MGSGETRGENQLRKKPGGGLEAKGLELRSWKGRGQGKGPDNKIQNSLAIKYKHAVPTVEKGRKGV